ncbi:MAG: hypothetical protein ACK559_31125, partial [bacterium]
MLQHRVAGVDPAELGLGAGAAQPPEVAAGAGPDLDEAGPALVEQPGEGPVPAEQVVPPREVVDVPGEPVAAVEEGAVRGGIDHLRPRSRRRAPGGTGWTGPARRPPPSPAGGGGRAGRASRRDPRPPRCATARGPRAGPCGAAPGR